MSVAHEVDKKQQGVASKTINSSPDPEPFLEWKYELNEETGKHVFKSIELSDKSKVDVQSLRKALKRTTGTSDPPVGERIINSIACGMTAERYDLRLNHTSTLLPVLRPNDETEALLLGQFLALQDSGMKCLRHANLPEQGFYHEEKLFLLANKLFNTANQTMQTILKPIRRPADGSSTPRP